MEGPGKLNIKTHLDTVMQNILCNGFDIGHADVQIWLKKRRRRIKPQFTNLQYNLQYNLHTNKKRRIRN